MAARGIAWASHVLQALALLALLEVHAAREEGMQCPALFLVPVLAGLALFGYLIVLSGRQLVWILLPPGIALLGYLISSSIEGKGGWDESMGLFAFFAVGTHAALVLVAEADWLRRPR